MEDVARAVQYITAHAEQFDVQPEQYAVIGYSSGGQITGLFGTDAVGYRNYGLPKPGALLLGYPVNTFRELKPGLSDPAGSRCACTAVLRYECVGLYNAGLSTDLFLVWQK